MWWPQGWLWERAGEGKGNAAWHHCHAPVPELEGKEKRSGRRKGREERTRKDRAPHRLFASCADTCIAPAPPVPPVPPLSCRASWLWLGLLETLPSCCSPTAGRWLAGQEEQELNIFSHTKSYIVVRVQNTNRDSLMWNPQSSENPVFFHLEAKPDLTWTAQAWIPLVTKPDLSWHEAIYSFYLPCWVWIFISLTAGVLMCLIIGSRSRPHCVVCNNWYRHNVILKKKKSECSKI